MSKMWNQDEVNFARDASGITTKKVSDADMKVFLDAFFSYRKMVALEKSTLYSRVKWMKSYFGGKS